MAMFHLEIEVYGHSEIGGWVQAKYLVHGWDDILWTNDIDEAAVFLKHSALKAEKELTDAQNKS